MEHLTKRVRETWTKIDDETWRELLDKVEAEHLKQTVCDVVIKVDDGTLREMVDKLKLCETTGSEQSVEKAVSLEVEETKKDDDDYDDELFELADDYGDEGAS